MNDIFMDLRWIIFVSSMAIDQIGVSNLIIYTDGQKKRYKI